MSEVLSDRKATLDEVVAHAEVLRGLAADQGLRSVGLRDDGALIIHSEEPGYRTANRLSIAASQVVGAYVHVLTDDVSGATTFRDL